MVHQKKLVLIQRILDLESESDIDELNATLDDIEDLRRYADRADGSSLPYIDTSPYPASMVSIKNGKVYSSQTGEYIGKLVKKESEES